MSRTAKRLIDMTVSAVALVALAPLLALCGVAVLATMGRPVLFRQTRPGHRGRPFVICKFRTMREAFTAGGVPLPDGDRLTPIGRVLRRSSLDELPQLWNVLRGELSLVGPRPLLTEYLPLYNSEQARRHEVVPGLTGWSQVNGRNAVGWAERLADDVWYVDHWSLGLDLKILARTVTKVLTGAGVSAEGAATMPRFRGSKGERG